MAHRSARPAAMIVFTSSQLLIAPTAMVAAPTRLRIRSENGVWYERPYSGTAAGVVCPDETSMMSAPWSLNARATSTDSSSVSPSGTQSDAEMRTLIGRSDGHAARTASNTSSGKRSRFSIAQPGSGSLKDVPAGYRCSKADVARTGGTLRMTARPASTMTEPGRTSIVITTTGLTYAQLVAIASGLVQASGGGGDVTGSAQMVAMCGQMVDGAMTFEKASAFAASNGYSMRIGSIDGEAQMLTMDFRWDRFTVSLVKNIVTGCTYG